MVERNLTIPYRFICFTDSTVLHKQKEFRGKVDKKSAEKIFDMYIIGDKAMEKKYLKTK